MDIKILSKVKSVILLTGETGVGKSTWAEKIHNISERKNQPFVAVNIAGLNSDLLTAELFGHKKGSFTGALSDSQGFCDNVQSGTLFLDEIGDLSLEDQVKILDLIEKKEYFPIGSRQKKMFDGTIILATNKNLEEMVENGTFRKDLYYRINLFVFKIPSLRNEPHLSEIIMSLFHDFKIKEKRLNMRLESCAYAALTTHQWEGNYRELNSVMEFILLTVKGDEVYKKSLPRQFQESKFRLPLNDNCFHSAVESFEKSFLECKLKQYYGRINKTSQSIGISKVTLISKVRKYRIDTSLYQMASG